MKNRLLKNMPAKIFAFLVACFLWMHVATEQKYEHVYSLPLTIEGLPEEYVLGAPLPDSVGVILKGQGKDLIKLFFAEPSIVIDGRGFKYSERFFDLLEADLRLPESSYELIGFTRSEPIRLVIDRYANAEVPIKNQLYLESADGYAIAYDKTTFEPLEIIIEGPGKIIRSVEFVKTVADTFRNLNASTTVAVDIEKELFLLNYTPSRVSAKIFVEPLITVTIEEIPVKIKGLQPSLGISLDNNRIAIVFSGIKTDIELLDRDDIHVFVDYSTNNTKQIQPVIIYPSELQIVSTQPEYFGFINK
ncbi:YbbR-like domain-containing protein [bacterium]|nr:YbbR-like domain-containing protein [bacterium]